MLRISEAARLGLHAAALIARSDRRVSVRELAERLHVSRSHLAKVMQRLVSAGLLDSERGARGGFRLAKQADHVMLLEVWEALDGEVSGAECLFDKPVCTSGRCAVGGLVGSVIREVRDRLGSISLADFVKGWGRE
jgi:Rrf2 family nitric oxide-sensitive transcriptional repressor